MRRKVENTQINILESVETNPLKPGFGDSMLEPDMEFVCLWCGEHHKPYNALVNDGWAMMNFCSVDCRWWHQRFGWFKHFCNRFAWWGWRKWLWGLRNLRYNKKCPKCKSRMEVWLDGELFMCNNCIDMYTTNPDLA